jgi:hypothetical protein
MQCFEWVQHQHAVDELFLHKILLTACFTHEGVFSIHNNHLWAQDNLCAIRERGHQGHFRVTVWAYVVGDIVMCPSLVPGRQSAQQYCNFLETVLLGLLEGLPVAVRRGGFSILWGELSGSD